MLGECPNGGACLANERGCRLIPATPYSSTVNREDNNFRTRMPDALVLATAGLLPGQKEDTNHLLYPRVDYLELKRYVDIQIINYDAYNRTKFGGLLRLLETQISSDLYLTLLGLAAHKKFSLIFTMSERAGIPYAGLKKILPRQTHFFTMFQSWSWRQERVISNLKLYREMDTIAVHCQSMKNHLTGLGFPANKIFTVPYSVDQDFFSPRDDIDQQSDLIISIGEPRSRNYPALFCAVDNLPIRLVAAASGMWYAREKKREIKASIPANVNIVRHLSPTDLRSLYAQSSFVVLPVYNQISSAGSTVIMEAGCMERCVIVTRSRGIQDYVIDGETGIMVEPDNPEALCEAISYLHAHPEEARRMGKNARQRIEAIYNLDNYVMKLAQLITDNLH
jgi:glycosyltransferase involved in cell wall biosynthesis